jgi:hypothetical protein
MELSDVKEGPVSIRSALDSAIFREERMRNGST